ncbi:NUDIX hydrolase, partial [Rhodococcus chondri]
DTAAGFTPPPSSSGDAAKAAPVPDRLRTSARVVLFDEGGRVLLLRGHDPAVPDAHFWFTIGGAVEPGETLLDAAVREIAEETGLEVNRVRVSGPMWRRVAVFPFNGEVLHSEEMFFAAQAPAFSPDSNGFTELERRMRLEHRWFEIGEVQDLLLSGEPLYPQELPHLLVEAREIATGRRVPEVRAIR